MSTTVLLSLAVTLLSARPAPDATIRFETGSTKIDAASEKTLEELARAFKERGVEKLLLVGHTDRRGGAAANRALSLARAKSVRDLMVKRGIPPNIFTVEGAGMSEPLDPGATLEADAKNRRVELFAGAVSRTEDVARVTWIFKQVDARSPIRVDWFAAELEMPLRRRFEVRTVEEAAGEITFVDASRLYLGNDSLVMIYDDPEASRAKPRLADVRLEEGSLFARLAKNDKPLAVNSPAGAHSLSTKSARVEYRKKKKASTVAVYEGSASVRSSGKEVAVQEGWGTRVKVGLPPEPPSPLLPPPEWRGNDVLFAIGSSTVALAWAAPTGTASVSVEIGATADKDMARPLRAWRVPGDGLAINGSPVGAYHARLSSIDVRGLIGKPGPSRRMYILAGLRDGAGRKLAVRDGHAYLAASSAIEVIPSDQMDVKLSLAGSTPADRVRIEGEGKHQLAVHVSAPGDEPVVLPVEVFVGAPEIVVDGAFYTFLAEDKWATTQLRFRTVTGSGDAVSGLKFAAYYDETDEGARLSFDTSNGPQRAKLEPRTETPRGSLGVVVEQQPGEFVLVHDELAGPAPAIRKVTLWDKNAQLALRVWVPVAAKPNRGPKAVEERPSWIYPFATVRGGAELQRPGGVRALLGFELGAGFRLSESIHLDGSLGTGWVRRNVRAEAAIDDVDADVVPLELRLSLGYRSAGGFGAHLGGMGGVGFVRRDAMGIVPEDRWTQVRAGAFLGVGYRFGLPEVFLEGTYTESGVRDTGDGLGTGPAILGGIRIGGM